jgi:hypothetical protein
MDGIDHELFVYLEKAMAWLDVERFRDLDESFYRHVLERGNFMAAKIDAWCQTIGERLRTRVTAMPHGT